MVLQQTAGPGKALAVLANVHPDMGRVLAITGALVFNLMLLMVLMAQVGAPAGYQPPKYEMVVVPIPVDVPKPPDPTPVPVQRATPTVPQPRIAPPAHADTPPAAHDVAPVQVSDAVAIDPADFVLPAGDPPRTAAPPAGPAQGMHLEYAVAPPPAYPRAQQMDGITGTVLLEVLVDVDGTPLRVEVHASSGNRQLDRAAREQVLRHWRFRPAMQGGRPVQATGLVPIDFRLD